MKKFKCQICGYVLEAESLSDDYHCPLCGVGADLFEEISFDEKQEENVDEVENGNRVPIAKENPSIMRKEELCIQCGICKNTCKNRVGIHYEKEEVKKHICINCGQCVIDCPTGSICVKPYYEQILELLQDKSKTMIVSTSPSVRVAIGEAFGMEAGTFSEGKMVAALRKLGFDYVFDVTFGADLTIMEEASELVQRIKENKNLPQFTSCCPAWVKYAEIYHDDMLKYISSCKSPIGMQGPMIKTYFSQNAKIDPSHIVNVAVTPCTAKKFEITREELNVSRKFHDVSNLKDMDYVITTTELVEMIQKSGIDFLSLKDEEYDDILGKGSGAGVIFGNTGGVMEAAIRTAYHMITGKKAPERLLEYVPVRGLEDVKETSVEIEGLELRVAVVHGLKNVEMILESIKNGTCQYHFVEVMNCRGGCIGGGGQPINKKETADRIKQKRMDGLYANDKKIKIKCSYENPNIQKAYQSFLEKPLSKLSEQLLHTRYHSRKEEYFK